MKLIAILAAALTLTACATNQEAYYKAVEARENRLAQQELRIDSAITEMAAAGGPEAKGMGIMYFGMKSAGAKQAQQMIAAPKSVADSLLPWASLIVPSLTQLYSIQQNTAVQLRHSDNSLAGKKADNEMIVDLVQGREPIIGTVDDVLLYPVAPVAPVAPVDPVDPVVE
jgi:hypothetical protein